MNGKLERIADFGAPGQMLPNVAVTPPGPESRSWQLRHRRFVAPMGPKAPLDARGEPLPPPGIVLSNGLGANLSCVDRNRYVDLAAGFGALLLGHNHPSILRAIQIQSERLLLALGDVYPSDAKIGLVARLAELLPLSDAQTILGQSGADAITCALKTAYLATGKPGVVAFRGSYHGLSYGPLGVTDLRPSYREPFSGHLTSHARFAPYPSNSSELDDSLAQTELALRAGAGAVLVEPILGRGGVVVPPKTFLSELRVLTKAHDALLIADEIWTGLGRSGALLASLEAGVVPDLLCLGKGLGGGLPMSACVGSKELMSTWSREEEVVHTSTFAGAPLPAATALATLDELTRGGLLGRANVVGDSFARDLAIALEGTPISVRGRGMMLGLDLTEFAKGGPWLQKALLKEGFVTSTGGGNRDVLVLTPPLVIREELLAAFIDALTRVVSAAS